MSEQVTNFVDSPAKNIVSLRNGDTGFNITDGIKLAPRAHLEISDTCPVAMRLTIQRAIGDGYLRAVANIFEYEQTFDLLKGN